MYSVKYSTTTPTGSLRKGNAVMNITQDNDGPTSTTGFYNGIAVPEGGYLVILTNSGASPAYWPCVGDTQLINLARNRFGQTSISQIRDAVEYFASRTDTFIVNSTPNEIVTDSLELYLDPKILSSYPTTGTGIVDLSGASATGRLNNGVVFDANTSTFDLDGGDDYIDGPLLSPPTPPFTLEIVGKFAQVPNRTNYEYFGAVGNANGDYTMASISKIGTQYSDPNFHGNLYCYVGTNDLSGTDLPVTGSEYYHVTVEALEEPPFIRIWRNNVEGNFVTGEIPSQPISGVSSRFWIGTWSASTWWLDGNIGSFKYYTKALSESERLQNYFGSKIVTDGLVFNVDPSNLVSYENGSTTTYNLTGSVNASLINGTNYLPNNGGIWDFDGTNDSIDTTSLIGTDLEFISNPSVNDDVLTWSIWSKNDSASSYYLFSTGAQTSSTGIAISYQAGNPFISYRSTTKEMSVNPGVSNWPLNEWIQWAFTSNGTNWVVYRNGVLNNSGTFVVDAGGDNQPILRIGGPNNSTCCRWDGKVGSVLVYNRALTEAEIKQNFEAQKSKFGF